MKRCALAVLLLLAAAVFTPLQPAMAAGCHPSLKRLALSAGSVVGGRSLTATATLSCETARPLSLRLKGFKGASLPSTVRVAGRKNTAKVTVKTSATAATRSGEIEATLGRVTREVKLTLTAAPRACSPKLVGLAAPSLVYAGDNPTGTVSLSCAPAAALKLTVTTDDTDLVVPASVTVSKGKSSVSFPMTAKANSGGQYAAKVTVHNGTQSVGAGITVDPGLSNFELSPGSEPNLVDPNVIFTGPAPVGGLTVKVASDNPAVTVPATASFQQYAYGGGVSGVVVNPVTVNTTVHISVTLGSRTLTASTVLVPPFNGHDSMKIVAQTPGDIYGLDSSLQYEVVLSNPAPADGLQVALSVPTGSASLQTDVTSTLVTGGFVEGDFRVSAGDVTKTTHATIEATVDGITTTLAVTIQPRLTTVNVPASVQGGSSFQGSVSLAGPADTDTTVYLQSSWGILTVPALVVIPAGATSAGFPVTTTTVDSPTNVDINASLGQTHATGTVTLTP